MPLQRKSTAQIKYEQQRRMKRSKKPSSEGDQCQNQGGYDQSQTLLSKIITHLSKVDPNGTGVSDIRCKCGVKMNYGICSDLKKMKGIYTDGAICDLCNGGIYNHHYLITCMEKNSKYHPQGYDICVYCYGENVKRKYYRQKEWEAAQQKQKNVSNMFNFLVDGNKIVKDSGETNEKIENNEQNYEKKLNDSTENEIINDDDNKSNEKNEKRKRKIASIGTKNSLDAETEKFLDVAQNQENCVKKVEKGGTSGNENSTESPTIETNERISGEDDLDFIQKGGDHGTKKRDRMITPPGLQKDGGNFEDNQNPENANPDGVFKTPIVGRLRTQSDPLSESKEKKDTIILANHAQIRAKIRQCYGFDVNVDSEEEVENGGDMVTIEGDVKPVGYEKEDNEEPQKEDDDAKKQAQWKITDDGGEEHEIPAPLSVKTRNVRQSVDGGFYVVNQLGVKNRAPGISTKGRRRISASSRPLAVKTARKFTAIGGRKGGLREEGSSDDDFEIPVIYGKLLPKKGNPLRWQSTDEDVSDEEENESSPEDEVNKMTMDFTRSECEKLDKYFGKIFDGGDIGRNKFYEVMDIIERRKRKAERRHERKLRDIGDDFIDVGEGYNPKTLASNMSKKFGEMPIGTKKGGKWMIASHSRKNRIKRNRNARNEFEDVQFLAGRRVGGKTKKKWFLSRKKQNEQNRHQEMVANIGKALVGALDGLVVSGNGFSFAASPEKLPRTPRLRVMSNASRRVKRKNPRRS